MTVINGIEYVTTSEAIERLGPDITADTIRGWVRTGKLAPAGRHPGAEWIFNWRHLLEAEQQTRTSRRGGRPRRNRAPSASMTITGLIDRADHARNQARHR